LGVVDNPLLRQRSFSHRWSPDGKWISYSSDEQMRTRPEGTIWEADVSEFLSRKTADQ
jgi:Tol biopolymer transport system component